MIFKRKSKPRGAFCQILPNENGNNIPADSSFLEWRRRGTEEGEYAHTIEKRDGPEGVDDADTVHSSFSERAKALPKTTGNFGSHHVLINTERVNRNISPLMRDEKLDNIALVHAKQMAANRLLQHSVIEFTAAQVLSHGNYTYIGENVTKSGSGTRFLTRQAHKNLFAKSEADRSNMLDPRFSSFGIGSEVNPSSGVVYICQLFAG